MVRIEDVKIGAYTHKLGTDWIAVDDTGEPLLRAKTKESAQLGVPAAAGYFTSTDFQPIADEDNLPNVAMYLDEAPTHYGYICLTENNRVLTAGYLRDGDNPYIPPETAKTRYLSGSAELPPVGAIHTLEGWKVHAQVMSTDTGKMFGVIDGNHEEAN